MKSTRRAFFKSLLGLSATAILLPLGAIKANSEPIEEAHTSILPLRMFSEGLAIKKRKRKKSFLIGTETEEKVISEFAYVNKNDEIVIPYFEAISARSFHDGFAQVKFNNGKFGYINKQGKVVIEPQFDSALLFHGDTASVCKNNRWGVIRSDGVMIVPCEYDRAFIDHGNGFVELNGREGSVNSSGVIQWEVT